MPPMPLPPMPTKCTRLMRRMPSVRRRRSAAFRRFQRRGSCGLLLRDRRLEQGLRGSGPAPRARAVAASCRGSRDPWRKARRSSAGQHLRRQRGIREAASRADIHQVAARCASGDRPPHAGTAPESRPRRLQPVRRWSAHRHDRPPGRPRRCASAMSSMNGVTSPCHAGLRIGRTRPCRSASRRPGAARSTGGDPRCTRQLRQRLRHHFIQARARRGCHRPPAGGVAPLRPARRTAGTGSEAMSCAHRVADQPHARATGQAAEEKP